MRFNIKNYPNFNLPTYEKEEVRDLGLSLNDSLGLNTKSTLPKIIEALNNSSLINIPNQVEVPIIFENFSWFGKLKTILKNFISRTVHEENFESSVAHYDNQTKSIHVFNGIFEPKLNDPKVQESYQTLISSLSSPNFLVNFFVLHEIGHAIHDQIRKEQSFNNFTDYFKGNLNNKIYQEQALIFRENFADMFAAIALIQIDKNNPNLMNDLKAFAKFRKDIKEEKYYTFNGLEQIISDFQNNKLNFLNTESIFKYVNVNTDKEIKIRLNDSLSKTLNSQEHNQQLGYLTELFKIEDKSINGIISFLTKEIGYQKPDSVMYESEIFEQGQNLYKKDSSNNIFKKIKNFCLELREDSKNTNSLKLK
jgi:hypothetical protein